MTSRISSPLSSVRESVSPPNDLQLPATWTAVNRKRPAPEGEDSPPARRLRLESAATRIICMRCLRASITEAADGAVQDTACQKKKASHGRCTRCAESNKKCIWVPDDKEAQRLARDAQVTRDAVYNARAQEEETGLLVENMEKAWSLLEKYVFRDPHAVEVGGKSETRMRRAGGVDLGAIVTELRLLREEFKEGIGEVISAVRELRESS